MKIQEQDFYWIKRQMLALQTAINERYGTNIVLLLKEIKEKPFKAEDIIAIACDTLDISSKKLTGRSKKTNLTFARYICYLLLEEYTTTEHPLKIAQIFNRNRTSIITGIRTGRNLLETQECRFTKMYSNVRTALQTKITAPAF